MDDFEVTVRRVTFGLPTDDIRTLARAGERLRLLADEADKVATEAWGSRRSDASSLYEEYRELSCAFTVVAKVTDAMFSDEDGLES